MNQFAKPGLAEEKLPPVSSADNGKVLGVNNGVWDKVAASGGTTVVANPTLAGTEADLTGLQVGDIKYKVPEGGGGAFEVGMDQNYALDKTAGEIFGAAETGVVYLVANSTGVCVRGILSSAHAGDKTPYIFRFIMTNPQDGSVMVAAYTAATENDYPTPSI